MSIIIVDCKTSYYDANKRNYKTVSVEEITDELRKKTVNTAISRYEVLKHNIRRLHFDIEKIPEDKPSLIYEFIRDFNEYMREECSIEKNMNYVLTFNNSSSAHKGLSYHVIFYEYSMDYRAIRDCLIAFINHDLGKPYADYIDVSIYSAIRLFKLPYYIGITKEGIDTNENNYHRIVEDSSESDDVSHVIIQDTEDCEEIKHTFDVKPEWKKSAKIISPFWQKGGTAGAIIAKAIKANIEANTEAVSDIILKKLSYSDHEKEIKETKDKITFIYGYYEHLSSVRQKIAQLVSKVELNEQNISIYKNTVDRLYEQAKEIENRMEKSKQTGTET